MRETSIFSRLTALMAVLLLLPALFFTPQGDQKPERTGGSITGVSHCHAELERFVTLVRPEEFLPSRSTHHLRSRTGRTTLTHRSDTLYFRRLQLFVPAVCILYVILRLWGRSSTHCQRFMIRYIHDQDGRKGISSLL